MNRDHYRKALTAYGPHTADYMVTRLVRMAGLLKGGPMLGPEPLDLLAQADEARQQAVATALGQAAAAAYDGWEATLPDDAGAPGIVAEPHDGHPLRRGHRSVAGRVELRSTTRPSASSAWWTARGRPSPTRPARCRRWSSSPTASCSRP